MHFLCFARLLVLPMSIRCERFFFKCQKCDFLQKKAIKLLFFASCYSHKRADATHLTIVFVLFLSTTWKNEIFTQLTDSLQLPTNKYNFYVAMANIISV